MTATQPLMSAKDVANFVGVPLSTLYAWRTRGQGPTGFKVGRHVRYDPADVRRWLEEQRDPAPA